MGALEFCVFFGSQCCQFCPCCWLIIYLADVARAIMKLLCRTERSTGARVAASRNPSDV